LNSSFDADTKAISDQCIASDHVLDGLISALAAWDAAEGRSALPTSDDMADALAEGWIHVRMQEST